MDLKTRFHQIFSLRRLFLYGNIALFVLFVAVAVKDQMRSWPSYQKEFKRLEIERIQGKLDAATTDAERDAIKAELKAAKRVPVEIRQLWIQDFDSVDRCITCHVGYDPISNPAMTTPYAKMPYSAPEGTAGDAIHKSHNIEKMGCVVCHGGQGLATDKEAAHGNVQHWESPLAKGALMQASCAKCHDNLADLKVNGEVYPSEIIRAKQLFKDAGCIGCHQVGGEGGPISVDLKEETSAKPLARIDFAYSGLDHKDWTLANWIKIHFTKDPATFVPGDPHGLFNTEPIAPSAMPPYLMPEADADALTAYILGMNRKGIPQQYVVHRPKEPEVVPSNPIQKGRYVYEKYGCAGCHGADARGGIRNYNYQYDVTPNLRRAVATYTRAELEDKLDHGVAFVAKHDPKGPNPPLYMPAWKDKIKGEELESLVTYLLSIKE